MPPFTFFAEARKRIDGRRVATRFERLPGKSSQCASGSRNASQMTSRSTT